MKLKIKADHIKAGDKLNRFGHFHPVSAVAMAKHEMVEGDVVKVTHDRGSLSFIPSHVVEVDRTFDSVEIAGLFCDVLNEWLTRGQMNEVRRRNSEFAAAGDHGVCATGDFCDSNMAMLAAFNRSVGNPDADEDFNFQDDEFTAVWNAAWSMAKRAKFIKGKIILTEKEVA